MKKQQPQKQVMAVIAVILAMLLLIASVMIAFVKPNRANDEAVATETVESLALKEETPTEKQTTPPEATSASGEATESAEAQEATEVSKTDKVNEITKAEELATEATEPEPSSTPEVKAEETVEPEDVKEESEEEPTEEANQSIENTWDGPVLTARLGTVKGPSGKETYYNLPMKGVVNIMRNLGYSEEEYPYWVREDGAKMLGPYIMVAANLDLRPRGTILPTSLGMGIVADTGDFAKSNRTQIDIAVAW